MKIKHLVISLLALMVGLAIIAIVNNLIFFMIPAMLVGVAAVFLNIFAEW